MNDCEKRDLCFQIIHNYLHQSAESEYLRNFDFSSALSHIYFTNSPHKNFSGLIRAFHRILHEKHEPIKLLLTGNPNENPSISKMISDLGLGRMFYFYQIFPRV